MKKIILGVVILLIIGAGAIAVAMATSPPIAWRVKVIGHMAIGNIERVSWGELLRMLKPGSGYYVENLVETQNIYGAVLNPHASTDDAKNGAELYRSNCQTCHGSDAIGNAAPALNTGVFKHGASDWALYKSITKGVKDTTMVAANLDEKQAWQVIAYLRSLTNTNDGLSNDAQNTFPFPAVTPARLKASRDEAHNWLTYSGSYDSTRYSTLEQITRDNAKDLQVKWIHQLSTTERMVEATPIVNDGIMFITEPPSNVHALDAKTGRTLWTFNHPVPNDVSACCGLVNRGVAVHGEYIFMATFDAKLLALNAKTGKVVWQITVDDYKKGVSLTAAPLVVNDSVIVGMSGGEFGTRGYLDAYDVNTGARLWRFDTIPGPGKPGHDSWAGDSWKTGGAPTWLTGSYDAKLNLIYWGVGNPGPLYQAHAREGDNLYSCSVVALNATTGELEWHFQFTPNDEHDWDANQIPVLVDRPWNGVNRKLMLWANRNAFFYVLDRESGEFLLGREFAEQNWADGLTAEGRPILRPETRVTKEGVLTWPGPVGATNWQSPTYSESTGLMYVAALEFPQIVFKQEDIIEHQVGDIFFGSGHQNIMPNQTLYTAVRAIDPDTGELIWEYRNPKRGTWWKIGGLLSTKGGILFGGDMKRMFVLNDTTGEALFEIEVGGRINASPMTHEVDGEQRLVLAAGRSIISLGLPATPNDVIVKNMQIGDDTP